MTNPPLRRGVWLGAYSLLFSLLTGSVMATVVPPVTFSFVPIAAEGDPWAQEIWADVATPSGKTLRVPAYYEGAGKFSVRVRAEEAGEYRLGPVTLQNSPDGVVLPLLRRETDDRQMIQLVTDRPMVRTSTVDPGRFVLSNGSGYFPLGANLAWATEPDRVAWYEKHFHRFSEAGLNWMRIWMAHWGGLNLDWLPEDMGPSPPLGQLDARVAANWDAIVANAEERGVYLQIVLQHHGQLTTKVNPNWNEHPWNAANPGGFLSSPTEFFTSAEAARLTRQKYRYIVARWGYSAAVMAWELFNEVHWVDALRIDRNEAAVARWHDEMASYLRSIDVYRHLVTTSTDDLESPIYRSMDYFQPHLYATNMLAGVRRFEVPQSRLKRPVFYGEIGNDNMRLSPEQKASAVEQVPLVWASLMGDGHYPGQLWEGDRVFTSGRLEELAAVKRFVTATGLAEREGLAPFSAAVTEAPPVALVIEPGDNWHRRAPVTHTVHTDGRQDLAYATIPRFVVGSPASIKDGYPNRITLRIDLPETTQAEVRFADAGPKGAIAQIRVDQEKVGRFVWSALEGNQSGQAKPRPAELSFPIPAGEHTVVVENDHGTDWFEFGALTLGVKTPVLTTMGRRGPDFVVLWVFNRAGIFAVEPAGSATGTLQIDDVPLGNWRLTWWDTIRGVPGKTVEIDHGGGVLSVATPPFSRHAAVILSRGPAAE